MSCAKRLRSPSGIEVVSVPATTVQNIVIVFAIDLKHYENVADVKFYSINLS